MRMRSIAKKNTIGGPRLKFVQITLLQDETLATKHPWVVYQIATHKKSFSKRLEEKCDWRHDKRC